MKIVMLQEAVEQIELNDFSGTYDSLELIYLRMRDKEHEGYFSYVPVWRMADVWFRGGDGYADVYTNPILINAIDGSVIDFYDEA